MPNKTYIIAEIGPNHNGSFNLAKKIIKKLKSSGVNAIKFQLANPDLVYSDDAFLAKYQKLSGAKSIKKMSIKNQLSKKNHIELSKICKKYKIDYLCSAFDIDSLDFLIKKIKIPIIKIPSGEITSIDILEKISKERKKILLSTGMSKIADIRYALKILNKNFKKKITLLHCVSSYPSPNHILNINLIKKLEKEFNLPVGYSDHSLGSNACIAAVACGAKVIEKHVTLSRNYKGPDHKSSMEVKNFVKMIKEIRKLEIIMGGNVKNISYHEKEIQKVARKSIVSKTDLEKGTILKKTDFAYKRPGTGISPMQVNKLVGKKITISIKKNKLIKLKNIK